MSPPPASSSRPNATPDIVSVADDRTLGDRSHNTDAPPPILPDSDDAPGSFFVRHKRLTRLGCVAAMVAIGWVIGQVSQPGVQSWYPLLAKPALTPPDWLFGVVWTILYILLGAGLARLLSHETSGQDARAHQRALTVYVAQLLANFAWNPIFFVGQSTWLAAAWIFVVLWLTAWSAFECLRVERITAMMLVPVVGWVGFACYLMTWIYLNN